MDIKRIGPSALLAAVAMVLAACATDDGADVDYTDDPTADPRVGEEVNRICFSRSISGFGDWDAGDGLILRRGVRDRYLVTLLRGCFVADRAQAIGVTDRFGGGCLDRGSRIFIADSPFPSRNDGPFESDVCRIDRIYKWDPDAVEDADESTDEGMEPEGDDA